MSDLPYVFHCTPCGKPHAGECPPKKLPDRTWGEVLDEFVEDIDKPLKQALVSAVQAGLPNFPAVGDFYTYEVWNNQLSAWQAAQAVYEITGWNQHKTVGGSTYNTVHYKAQGHTAIYNIDFGAFEPAGIKLPSGTIRFVALPNNTPPPPSTTYMPQLGSVWKCQLFLVGRWTPPDHRRWVVTSVDPFVTTIAEQNPGSASSSMARHKYPNAAWSVSGYMTPGGNMLRFIP